MVWKEGFEEILKSLNLYAKPLLDHKALINPVLPRGKRLLWDVLAVYRNRRELSSSLVTHKALASVLCQVTPCWAYPPYTIGSNVFLPPAPIYIASCPLDSTELSEQLNSTQHMGNTLSNYTCSVTYCERSDSVWLWQNCTFPQFRRKPPLKPEQARPVQCTAAQSCLCWELVPVPRLGSSWAKDHLFSNRQLFLDASATLKNLAVMM